ncbi:hypothetical protein CBS101457_001238 [Exobasidium rhododendri]|nr:hypothetical protein CBS101457_001238 [Exobasidium rhododendri]
MSRRGKEGSSREERRSSSVDDDTSDEEYNDEDTLAALEAHFAESYEVPAVRPTKASREKKKHGPSQIKEAGSSVDGAVDVLVAKEEKSAKAKQSTVQALQKREPQTVVFGGGIDGGSLSNRGETKGDWRKFMSSKVRTKTEEERQVELAKNQKIPKTKKARPEGESAQDQEDERQAETNDRALSTLLSTTLFAPGGSGASTTRSNGRPNLGSNDTLARLLELTAPSVTGNGKSQGRGLGAAMLKSQDMSKMPATIRHGMRRVEMENQEKELQRQKELGNYHHTIKGLIGKRDGLDLIMGTKEKDRKKRTREKGLAMGVGKFSGGTLKLSDGDVQRINSSSASGSKRRKP